MKPLKTNSINAAILHRAAGPSTMFEGVSKSIIKQFPPSKRDEVNTNEEHQEIVMFSRKKRYGFDKTTVTVRKGAALVIEEYCDNPKREIYYFTWKE